MERTAEQREIARVLADAWTRADGGVRIVYQGEWLGWLPYGPDHRVDVERADGKDTVSRRFPDGWELADLLAIQAARLMRRVREIREDADDLHRIVYEMGEEE